MAEKMQNIKICCCSGDLTLLWLETHYETVITCLENTPTDWCQQMFLTSERLEIMHLTLTASDEGSLTHDLSDKMRQNELFMTMFSCTLINYICYSCQPNSVSA